MIGHPEHVDALLPLAPVRPDTLEAARPVVERVGEQADVRVAISAQLAVEVHPCVGLRAAELRLRLRGLQSLGKRLVRSLDEVGDMSDEAARDAAIGNAVIEDE